MTWFWKAKQEAVCRKFGRTACLQTRFGNWRHLALQGALALVLSGCLATRNAYHVPDIQLGNQFKNAQPDADSFSVAEEKDGKGSEKADAASADQGMEAWWRTFGNAELDALIDRGIANNPDVRIATLRLAQASEQFEQTVGAGLPEVSVPALGAIQAPGGTVGSVPVGSSEARKSQKSYQASLRGTWRADLWGERSALADAARFRLWQAAFERDNVQRNVVASLASAYVEYVSLNDRLRIARETETVLSGMLATIEKRVAAGDATLIDLEQQKAAIFSARAAIPSLEQQREDSANTIAFLLGAVPSSLKLSDQGLDSLQLPAVLPGLPSSLLLRRPDVRLLEAKMLAADADIDVARARVLPPIDLSAQSGYSSLLMSQLFQPKNLFWNAVVSLTANIFDGGRKSSEKAQAKAVHEEMVESYARTIYQATREVEGALATVRMAEKRIEAQEEATVAARRAWDISKEVYAAGSVDFLTLLDTERTYHRYLDEYQRISMDQYRGYISLFQALGGGVKVVSTLPGRGVRPLAAKSGVRVATAAPAPKAFNAEGVDWVVVNADKGSTRIEEFWQVELSGLYHRATIGPAWRDLRTRYPLEMEKRILRPRLQGRIEDGGDAQVAWYRLYVVKFATAAAAHQFCAKLQSNQQRCRVLSSRSDETLPPPGNLAGETVATDSKAVPSQAARSEERPKMPPAKAETALPTTERAAPQETDKGKVAYSVQLGAFANLENAAIAQSLWQFRGYEAFVSEMRDGDGGARYAVRTGVFAQRRDAALLAQEMRRKDEAPAVLVPILLDRAGKPQRLENAELLMAGMRPSSTMTEPPEAPVATEKTEAVPAKSETLALPVSRPLYALQFGAFAGPENAAVALSFWRGKGYDAYVSEIHDVAGRGWYAVRTGAYRQRREAATAAVALGRREETTVAVVSALLDGDGRVRRLELDAAGRPQTMPPPSAVAVPTAAPVVLQSEKVLPATKPTVNVVSRQEASPTPVSESAQAPASLPARAMAVGRPAYSVQLGAYANQENAHKSAAEWQARGYEAYVCAIRDAQGEPRYAVRLGVFTKRRAANALVKNLGRNEAVKPLLVSAIVDAAGKPVVLGPAVPTEEAR